MVSNTVRSENSAFETFLFTVNSAVVVRNSHCCVGVDALKSHRFVPPETTTAKYGLVVSELLCPSLQHPFVNDTRSGFTNDTLSV